MRKFKALEDIIFFNQTIIDKDEIIELTNSYQVNRNNIQFPLLLEEVLKDSRFIEVTELNLTINEISDDEELQVHKYRIQLDITTNRKKLREIEKFLRDSLNDMI